MKDLKITEFIIDNNHQFVVGDKPATLGSIPDKVDDLSFQAMLESYLKHDIYAISRIDRPVSGIVLYAAKKDAAVSLTEQIKKREIKKVYYAVVEGKVEKKENRLTNRLKKGNNKKSYIAKEGEEGKEAQLDYKVVMEYDNYTLLEVRPLTGRFHQIRAQLAEMGNAIKGDVKYGARRGNKDRSIHLHAHKITFKHPVSGNKQTFTAKFPDSDSLWQEAMMQLELK